MAAPAFRATQSGQFTSVTSVTTTMPAFLSGDYAILHFTQGGTQYGWVANMTSATGWYPIIGAAEDSTTPSSTPPGPDVRTNVWGKLLSSSETAPTINFDVATSGVWSITTYSGVDSLVPYEFKNAYKPVASPILRNGVQEVRGLGMQNNVAFVPTSDAPTCAVRVLAVDNDPTDATDRVNRAKTLWNAGVWSWICLKSHWTTEVNGASTQYGNFVTNGLLTPLDSGGVQRGHIFECGNEPDDIETPGGGRVANSVQQMCRAIAGASAAIRASGRKVIVGAVINQSVTKGAGGIMNMIDGKSLDGSTTVNWGSQIGNLKWADIDGWAVHAYNDDVTVPMDAAHSIHQNLVAHGHANMELYITENGYPTDPLGNFDPAANAQTNWIRYTAAQQSNKLQGVWDDVQQRWLIDNVRLYSIFGYSQYDGHGANGYGHTGLIEGDYNAAGDYDGRPKGVFVGAPDNIPRNGTPHHPPVVGASNQYGLALANVRSWQKVNTSYVASVNTNDVTRRILLFYGVDPTSANHFASSPATPVSPQNTSQRYQQMQASASAYQTMADISLPNATAGASYTFNGSFDNQATTTDTPALGSLSLVPVGGAVPSTLRTDPCSVAGFEALWGPSVETGLMLDQTKHAQSPSGGPGGLGYRSLTAVATPSTTIPLTINIIGSGSVAVQGAGTFSGNTTIQVQDGSAQALTAIAAAGWSVGGWQGHGSTTATANFNVSGGTVITVVFTNNSFSVATVNPGGSVTNAINAAGSGGTVLVRSGTYNETPSGKSNVKVRGIGATRPILSPSSGNAGLAVFGGVANFTADWLQISDISRNVSAVVAGLYLGGASITGCLFNNLKILRISNPKNAHPGVAGVFAGTQPGPPFSTSTAIRGCTFRGLEIGEIGAGTYDGSNESMGMFLATYNCLIDNCTIYLCRKEAIRDYFSLRNTFTNNKFLLNWSGGAANYGNAGVWANNSSYYNQVGFEPKHVNWTLAGGGDVVSFGGTPSWGAGETASDPANRNWFVCNTTYANTASSMDNGQGTAAGPSGNGAGLIDYTTYQNNLFGDNGSTNFRDWPNKGSNIASNNNNYNHAGAPTCGNFNANGPNSLFAIDFNFGSPDCSFPLGPQGYDAAGTQTTVNFQDPLSGNFDRTASSPALTGASLAALHPNAPGGGVSLGTQKGAQGAGLAAVRWEPCTVASATCNAASSAMSILTNGKYENDTGAWTSNGPFPIDITLNLGSSQPYKYLIVEVSLSHYGDGATIPKQYEIAVSPTGVSGTFTTLKTGTNPQVSDGENYGASYKYTLPTERTEQFVRFRVTNLQSGTTLQLHEIKLGRLVPTSNPAPVSPAFGAWIGNQFTGTEAPFDWNAVTAYESANAGGKHTQLINFSSSFAVNFNTSAFNNCKNHNAIPFFSWACNTDTDAAVAGGSKDAYITNWATSAKNFGGTIYLRFAWEMNGSWFLWGLGNGALGPPNTAADYVAMWRHVHDVFVNVGATNVKWVWCPNVGTTNTYASLYPGDAYVDFTGLDGYNPGSPWTEFNPLFGASYDAIQAITSKPLIIGEVGCTESGGNKAQWITNMFNSLPTRFPNVADVLWFNKNEAGPGGHTDWPIESSAASQAAYAAGLPYG